MRRLRQEVRLADYMLASMARRGVTGAAAELNQALGIAPKRTSRWSMIAPEVEIRAAIDGDSETNQGSMWVDALFHDCGGHEARHLLPECPGWHPVPTLSPRRDPGRANTRGRPDRPMPARLTVGYN